MVLQSDAPSHSYRSYVVDAQTDAAHNPDEDNTLMCYVCGHEFEDHALDFNIDLINYQNLL